MARHRFLTGRGVLAYGGVGWNRSPKAVLHAQGGLAGGRVHRPRSLRIQAAEQAIRNR
jgi:hypothetical protein